MIAFIDVTSTLSQIILCGLSVSFRILIEITQLKEIVVNMQKMNRLLIIASECFCFYSVINNHIFFVLI